MASNPAETDPFSVVGRFLVKSVLGKVRSTVAPQRIFYDAQKLRVRATRSQKRPPRDLMHMEDYLDH